jgi:DinB superfamily
MSTIDQPGAQQTVQPTLREVLERLDRGWSAFRDRVHDLPSEQLELHISEGSWTRKQMLGHIAAWHDLTVERLARFAESGQPNGVDEDEDVINARAAHAAVGRTSGELVLNLDDSFRRLRREVGRLSDAQLRAHDSWATSIIAGNTFDHYEDHLADLEPR